MKKQTLFTIIVLVDVICMVILVACSKNTPATSIVIPNENQDPTPYAGKWYGETVQLTQAQLKELGMDWASSEEVETKGLIEDIGEVKTDAKGTTTFQFQGFTYTLAPGLNPKMLSQEVLADRGSRRITISYLENGDAMIAIMVNAE